MKLHLLSFSDNGEFDLRVTRVATIMAEHRASAEVPFKCRSSNGHQIQAAQKCYIEENGKAHNTHSITDLGCLKMIVSLGEHEMTSLVICYIFFNKATEKTKTNMELILLPSTASVAKP